MTFLLKKVRRTRKATKGTEAKQYLLLKVILMALPSMLSSALRAKRLQQTKTSLTHISNMRRQGLHRTKDWTIT